MQENIMLKHQNVTQPYTLREPQRSSLIQANKVHISKNQTLNKQRFSSTGLLPPPKLIVPQCNRTDSFYRPQSTILLNKLNPYEKSLIPVTWTSCQCPALEKQLKETSQQYEKNSFIPAKNKTYYNRSYYNYLKQFSGNQEAKLLEPKCMYTLAKQRVKSLEQQKSSPQIIGRKPVYQERKFMQNTKKIFGNSNFFYNGENFQRADELKQIEYHPSNIDQLRSCLYYDERTKSIPKTTIQNNIMEGIIREGSDILQNQQLVDQLFKLKNQKLIKQYQDNQFSTKDRTVRFVYNDYHQMGSKGGYSRGALGTFYTR